jgi:hypothetical protein
MGSHSRSKSQFTRRSSSFQSIGFELVGPKEAAIVVPVEVNGEGPFDLVVDIGGTFTCLDESLAERLELRDAPRSLSEQGSAAAAGARYGSAGSGASFWATQPRTIPPTRE